MTKDELEENESSSAACSSSSNSPSSILSAWWSHSHRWSFSWNDNSNTSSGTPPDDWGFSSAGLWLFSLSSSSLFGVFIMPPCLIKRPASMLLGFTVDWAARPTLLFLRSFPSLSCGGLFCNTPWSIWTDAGLSVFCLWWLPKTFVCSGLWSELICWSGELNPLWRFSLLSEAVLRWTGSRWATFLLPLRVTAGSELLREMTLARTCGLRSFTSSVWDDKDLRLVNLERPSPRFRKALLGGVCMVSAPVWLCDHTHNVNAMLAYLYQRDSTCNYITHN